MSVRTAPSHTPARHRTRHRMWGCGMLAACALLAAIPAGPTVAQPPDDTDTRPPLPADEPARPPLATRFRFPQPDRAMFAGIRDESELLSEAKSTDEYLAYNEVVQFLQGNGFTAADLEQNATRDLVWDDLHQKSSRGLLRLELVRFDGKLTKFRKIRMTRGQADADPWLVGQAENVATLGLKLTPDELGGTGVKALYQGWLIPAGEPTTRQVCVVFTELPPGFDPPTALNEWVTVDRWVAFAGYSFKLLAYPGPDADPKVPAAGGWRLAPLLVGVSFTPIPEPVPDIHLYKGLRIFRKIIDDAPITHTTELRWEESEAWNRVVLHARQFTPEQLEAAARKDVTFADLFKETRRDHKLELVQFKGRLIRLRQLGSTERLKEAGLTALYEGWIIPENEPAANPVCVVVSELPPGLDPEPPGRGLMNRWVAFEGYSFKLMHYESQERDKDERLVSKRAPLLIGRTIRPLDTTPANPYRWDTFVPALIGAILGMLLIGFLLSRWFRRGDRRAQAEIDGVRQKNPFEG